MSECEYMVVYLDEMVDTVDLWTAVRARSCTEEVAGSTEYEREGGGYHRHGDERSVTGCAGRSGGRS